MTQTDNFHQLWVLAKMDFQFIIWWVLTPLTSRNEIQLFPHFTHHLMSLPLKFNHAHTHTHICTDVANVCVCCLWSTWFVFLALCSISNKAVQEEGGFDFPDRPLSAFVYLLLRCCSLVLSTGSLCFINKLFITAFYFMSDLICLDLKMGMKLLKNNRNYDFSL